MSDEQRARDATAATAEAHAILRSGRPNAGPDGVAALQRAVALGSGEAAAKLAHFAAAGLGQAADWALARRLLQQSAALGWTQAADEGRLLSGGELSALVAPRAMTTVSSAPLIRTVTGFLSAEECAWLIESARARLGRAAIYARDAAGTEQDSKRTNSSADFGVLDVDAAFTMLRTRIANTIGLPLTNFERPSVLHYAPGQQFEPHYDFLDTRFPGPAADVQAHGQRIATFLVYLNEDFEGGETEFLQLGYKYKGKTGDAIVFGNVQRDMTPDFRTRHAGLPPTSGEKWLLSQWVRDRASA